MDKLGDLSQYTNKSDLKNSFINVYNSENNPLNYVLANYEFAFEMGIGGYVFAKKGTKKILGFGKILSDYIYDEDRDEYRSIRQVEWIKTGGRGYYWLNANPIIWDFDSIEVGESIIYTSHNDKGNKRNKYKYFQSAKPVPFKILQNHLDLKSCEPIINN